MIPREFATDRMDLPHEFQSAGENCTCGRPQDDPLHEPAITEKAAFAVRFETEKGS